jgi:hypothetical protein
VPTNTSGKMIQKAFDFFFLAAAGAAGYPAGLCAACAACP